MFNSIISKNTYTLIKKYFIAKKLLPSPEPSASPHLFVIIIPQIITANTIIMKNIKILLRITKKWHRDMKWANAIGKMVPTQGRVATNFQFVKNIISAKHNKVKHNKMRCACNSLILHLTNVNLVLSLLGLTGIL